MSKSMTYGLAGVLAVCVFGLSAVGNPQNANASFDATTLVALVAGDALPENIVSAVKKHGLSFTPTAQFKTQLSDAGATSEILEAVSKATVAAANDGERINNDVSGREHLALAGKRLRTHQLEEAAKEVDQALRAGIRKSDAGFVMGECLKHQEEWAAAAEVYTEVLKQEPGFPEARTKLSYVLFRVGDQEESLRQAKMALAETPNNAEAHKNAALALEEMRKFDAAEHEFREALRIKPDYEKVRFDLGILFFAKGDIQGAINEYSKALAMDPKDINAYTNLAYTYNQKHDFDNAIRVLRQAKKVDPRNVSIRQDLGSTLMHANQSAQAAVEFRELEAMAPESEICHVCLASALVQTGDLEGAKKEYQIARKMDPVDSSVHAGLGAIYETQKNYPDALKEYEEESRLDPDGADGHWRAGLVLLIMKDSKRALGELEAAEKLDPGNADVHEGYARALAANGDAQKAAGEFKEALLLNGQDIGTQLDYARFLEKQGDWVGAMEHYRLAKKYFNVALAQPAFTKTVRNADGDVQAAEARLKQHLSELRAAGKGAEATALEAKLAGADATKGLSGKVDAAMDAGMRAFRENNFAEAERSYKNAVEYAEQLNPHEARLALSLGYLGTMYFGRKDWPDAQQAYERQLKVVTELYGANSPQISMPLTSLGQVYAEQGDYAKAETLFLQNLTLSQKNQGDTSIGYVMGLRAIGELYYSEKQYEKALPFALQGVKTGEILFGPEGMQLVGSKGLVCRLYDGLKQAEKAEACDRQLIVLMEKTYGENSPVLAPTLTSQAKALRALGRNAEADEVEKRLHGLQNSTVGLN